MALEKAYKLLAAQEGISNSEAKSMIDRGLVYAANKKVMIARGDIDTKTLFKVEKVEKIKPIFENEDLVVVDKPAHVNSDEIERQFKPAVLLHRLDKETSGVLMLVKNEEFREKAIQEFKKDRVYKEYIAWVEGIITEPHDIDKPILTTLECGMAKSKIDLKRGKSAKSTVYPVLVEGNKSKIKVVIESGRTHQIRVHLNSVGLPIIGDAIYGRVSSNVNRVLLHSKVTKIFDYTFEAAEPKEFRVYDFNS